MQNAEIRRSRSKEMKLKQGWINQRNSFRQRELELIFGRCPEHLFQRGLEMGAGDGFQSRLIKWYVEKLVCTDLNADRLQQRPAENVSYFIYDAEEIGQHFEAQTFDLVFSSNMLEHLPNVQACLAGTYKILKDDGIAIHLMPNRVWKSFNLLLFYPDLILTKLERLINKSKRFVASNVSTENNLKTQQKSRKARWRYYVPQPHGAYGSHLEEFKMFARARWIQEFEANGFEVVKVITTPFATGYGFGFDGIKKWIEKLGVGTEFVYITVKRGCQSPYVKYF
jgi:2-polyprenyl-3-methyl-5-hydroxy-6-metoxy-1,4-benzoquinol methylase